jgi:hypothetical protein
MLIRSDIIHSTTAVMPTESLIAKIEALVVLKEGLEKYGNQVEHLYEQCPQSWRFIRCSMELCRTLVGHTIPKTNELMYLSSVMPTAEEWRMVGKALKKDPSSEEGRIHTWWWYRYRAVLRIFLQFHEHAIHTCVQSIEGTHVR